MMEKVNITLTLSSTDCKCMMCSSCNQMSLGQTKENKRQICVFHCSAATIANKIINLTDSGRNVHRPCNIVAKLSLTCVILSHVYKILS